jgi:hypothetical protein
MEPPWWRAGAGADPKLAGQGYGGTVTDTDAIVERILTRYATITVVGASAHAAQAAHTVPACSSSNAGLA